MSPTPTPTPTPRQKSGLTALFVHKTRRVGKHYDNRGHGLYLDVSTTGSKRWEQRITLATRSRYLGLGRYPDVSLREARKRALRNRQLVDDGIDPYVHKRSQGHRIVPTFAEAVEHVIRLRRPKWTGEKTEQRWRRALELYVFSRARHFPRVRYRNAPCGRRPGGGCCAGTDVGVQSSPANRCRDGLGCWPGVPALRSVWPCARCRVAV